MTADAVRSLFTTGRFRPAAPRALIERAEAELGVRLPTQLRELYVAFDGFREARGNAAYLLPLYDDEGAGSRVGTSKFFWTEHKEYQPALDFCPFLFFGSSAADEHWAMGIEPPHTLIAYHHGMEDEYEPRGPSIAELYRSDQQVYDEVERDAG